MARDIYIVPWIQLTMVMNSLSPPSLLSEVHQGFALPRGVLVMLVIRMVVSLVLIRELWMEMIHIILLVMQDILSFYHNLYIIQNGSFSNSLASWSDKLFRTNYVHINMLYEQEIYLFCFNQCCLVGASSEDAFINLMIGTSQVVYCSHIQKSGMIEG